MNRPRNRQPRPQRQNENQRGPPRQPRGPQSGRPPPTPQQIAGTVPTLSQVVPGASVFIILKEDQPTGEETNGVVQDILTRGNHPRGIKVRLRDGQVGRVQRMDNGSTPTGESSGSAMPASSSGFSRRYTDMRYDDEFPEGPPPRSLVDFMPELDESQGDTTGVGTGVPAIKCPFCEDFEGDEVAVTHHIDQQHLT